VSGVLGYKASEVSKTSEVFPRILNSPDVPRATIRTMELRAIALMVAWRAALSSEPGRGVARHHVGSVISARLHVSRLAQSNS
jgi:hypothetical protein